MIGYIYLTSNEINDILYIGKRQKPRFEKCYKGSGTHLKLAFTKYGRDKFTTSIIEECNTIEDLNQAEKKWIKFYRDNGYELYNIADGGDGGNCIKWDEFPPEKMAIAKEKNSLAHKGENNSFYGKTHNEEWHRHMSKKLKGRIKPKEESEKAKNTKRAKLPKIVQTDKNTGEVLKVWKNWCEASEMFAKEHGRCAYGHIADCCNGKRKSAWGYGWQYQERVA